ncbi:uncharacterized protein LOC121524587 [Cheilinus undulatus]|uniref:uncharacterized protein LOC121524587 n=1 Tax=Cheilinus undulatus TaxID=241271 RepID=UPI001BD514B0|nr:uncharacterized protein LOC121524587 [Cheilinus undulatus]
MNSVRQPDELKLSGNVDENWRVFKQSFELYTPAIGLENDQRRKIALLLSVAGRSALEVYNTFVFTEDEKDKYDAVIAKFEQYCTPKKNETSERYVFRNRIQKESESIEEYITDLRLKSQSCNFGTLCDSMVRDQIVTGVQDKRVRMHLLKETDLTLEKAIKICKASEGAKAQIKSFCREDETAEVYTVQQTDRQTTLKRREPEPKQEKETKRCGRCGNKHAPKQCPAFGKDCRKCGGKNHFAKCCFSKKKVQLMEKASHSEDDGITVSVGAVEDASGVLEEERIAHINVNDTDVPLTLDTGAQRALNSFSEADMEKVFEEDFPESNSSPKAQRPKAEENHPGGECIDLTGDSPTSARKPSEEDENKLSLMSWNVDGLDTDNLPERARGLFSFLLLYTPDVVFLQELIPPYIQYLKKRAVSYLIIEGGEDGYFTGMMLKKSRVNFVESEIVPYPTTRMGRNLLVAQVTFKGQKLCLMTTHLESCKDHSQERMKQLRVAIEKMREAPADVTVLFGGDTNLRDTEVAKVGLPPSVCDVWEHLGKQKHCRYTWDTKVNTNKTVPFVARCRFDRIFFRATNKDGVPRLAPDHMALFHYRPQSYPKPDVTSSSESVPRFCQHVSLSCLSSILQILECVFVYRWTSRQLSFNSTERGRGADLRRGHRCDSSLRAGVITAD